MARRWLDRFLSLFMPVVRYRCASAGCGWEGLLLRRHRMRLRTKRPTARTYRPQWLEPARLRSSKQPRQT